MHTKALKNKIQEEGLKKAAVVLFFLSSFLFSLPTNAQCAMCRAALEGEGNTAKAEAVNDGIVYLMVIPYLLVGVIGYMIYRTGKNLRKKT